MLLDTVELMVSHEATLVSHLRGQQDSRSNAMEHALEPGRLGDVESVPDCGGFTMGLPRTGGSRSGFHESGLRRRNRSSLSRPTKPLIRLMATSLPSELTGLAKRFSSGVGWLQLGSITTWKCLWYACPSAS